MSTFLLAARLFHFAASITFYRNGIFLVSIQPKAATTLDNGRLEPRMGRSRLVAKGETLGIPRPTHLYHEP